MWAAHLQKLLQSGFDEYNTLIVYRIGKIIL